MNDFLTSALSALPSVAASPLALVGYTLVLVCWLVLGLRVRRNKQLLLHLHQLPESDRLTAIELEMGAVRLKDGVSAEQWLRAKVHLYYFVGFLALCVVVILLFAIAAQRRTSPLALSPPANVTFVDLSVEDKGEAFPVLDLRFRNAGGEVAFLTRMVIHITNVYELENPRYFQETHVDADWVYHVDLDLKASPQEREVHLSESIKPNDVARIKLVLGHGGLTLAEDKTREQERQRMWGDLLKAPGAADQKPKPGETLPDTGLRQPPADSRRPSEAPQVRDQPDGPATGSPAGYVARDGDYSVHIIRLYIDVFYNEGNERLTSEALIFAMPSPIHYIMATSFAKPNAAAIVDENIRKLKEAAMLQGKKTQQVTDMLK